MRLFVQARRAHLRRALALVDVAAIHATPGRGLVLFKDLSLLDVLGQCQVALFVLLFRNRDGRECSGNVLEPLFRSDLGKRGIQLCPLVVLASRGGQEVLNRAADHARRESGADFDLAALQKLEERPQSTRMVYGNIDGSEIRSACPVDLLFVKEGIKVFMTHIGGYPGRYTRRVYEILKEEKPDLYICGHSHILKIMRDKNLDLLHMNPGAIGYKGFHKFRTLILFKLEQGSISDVKAVDLGPRGRISPNN